MDAMELYRMTSREIIITEELGVMRVLKYLQTKQKRKSQTKVTEKMSQVSK